MKQEWSTIKKKKNRTLENKNSQKLQVGSQKIKNPIKGWKIHEEIPQRADKRKGELLIEKKIRGIFQ